MADLDPTLQRWFEKQRGVTTETLERWGVYSEGKDKLIFPWPHNEKIREGTLTGERKMRWRDVNPERSMYGVGHEPEDVQSAFIVEGETDTMRLDQALRSAGKDTAAVYGLSGSSWWLPEFASVFAKPDRVYVIIDNDDPYTDKGQKAVEAGNKGWLEIRRSLGPKAVRVYLPQGVKDVCEFFDAYDIEGTDAGIEALSTLCRGVATGRLNFNYLDMTQPIPEYDFLVDDWICQGDVVLAFGPPGSGKSMAAMALAVAVANGEELWLGKKVNHQGPVVHLDQENPLDVFLNRYAQLGLSPEGRDRFHPLWHQGIRLDMHGDAFMEDMLNLRPQLIILDSLSKIHGAKENDSGEMSAVFRDYIIPLARDTGAAVLLLHHVIKGNEGTSFERVRGSSSIPADIDFGMDFRPTGIKDQFRVIPFKPRRGQGASPIEALIEDYGTWPSGIKKTRIEPVMGPAPPM